MKTGTPYCDDDVCMTVLALKQAPVFDGTWYSLNVRLSSRANRGPRSATGAQVYLADERHREYFPISASPLPFDTAISPGQSVDTSLAFEVPSDAGKPAFEIRRDRIGYTSFMIGSRDLLRKPMLTLALD